MNLIVYPLLRKKSKTAMLRVVNQRGKNRGHLYNYVPNGRLLNRLSTLLPLSKSEILDQVIKEREYLLANILKIQD